ncbi:MAG: glycosyltransferase family 4 protein [Verrucomicrobiota bacterium]
MRGKGLGESGGVVEGRDEVKALLESSGLFNAEHVASQTRVRPGEALDYYLEEGGVDPHPLFREGYYRLQCPDLCGGGMTGLEHYLRTGAKQGRRPHPLFDPEFYGRQFVMRDLAPAEPLGHYLRTAVEFPERDPHPMFDTSFYLETYRDVRESGLNPLLHYVTEGGRERDVNVYFDAGWYGERAGEVREGESFLEHYLEMGSVAGHLGPNRFFDTEYFWKHNPGVRALGGNPLGFYLEEGMASGRLVSRAQAEILIEGMGVEKGLGRGTYRGARVLVFVFGDGKGARLEDVLKRLVEAKVRERCEVSVFAGKAAAGGGIDFDDVYLLDEVIGVDGGRAALATLVASLRSPCKPTTVITDDVARLRACGVGEASDLGEVDFADLAEGAVRVEGVEGSRGRVIIPLTDWAISGVNRCVEAIGMTLRRGGWDVRFLATGNFFDGGPAMGFPRVPLRVLDLPRTKSAYWWATMRDHLESLAPAVVITAHDFRFNSLASVAGDELAFIGVLHSDDAEWYEHASLLGDYFDRIVAVSERVRGELVKRERRLAERVTVIPNGVRPGRGGRCVAPRRGEAIRLIYTGRVVEEQKRVYSLARIAEELDAVGTPYKMTIVGDGEDREGLEREMGDRVESGKVRFTGTLSMDGVHRELSEHHVFLLTSEYEGLPLSLLEAASHGCVPVVSGIGSGIPDVVWHGKTGYVVPLGNFGRYAALITRLHQERKEWEALSKGVYELFEAEYTVEAMADRYEELIEACFEEIGVRRDGGKGDGRRARGEPARSGVARFGDLVLDRTVMRGEGESAK